MAHNDTISEEVKEIWRENEEIVREVRSDLALLTEIRYRILSKKLQKQLRELAKEAVDTGKVEITSVDDFIALLELDLKLR